MYELVLIENKIYGGKKAGKVILFFRGLLLSSFLTRIHRRLAATVLTPSVWASTSNVSPILEFIDNFVLILVFLEYLASFELIDKAQGNDGVWCWEKVDYHFFREFF